ncbi:hypothetical protein R80B4_01664 [Fibrobacteres bacterium R8-0-B4]
MKKVTSVILLAILGLALIGLGCSDSSNPSKPVSPKYTLTILSAGGGTAVIDLNSTSIDSGATVWVTARPDIGYTFAGWSGDASGLMNPVSITMNGDKTLTASFQPITPDSKYELTASVTPVGGGTVTKSPNLSAYDFGTEVTLTAAPAAGYTFVGWTGAATGTAASITITVNGNTGVTANFEAVAGPDPVGPSPWDPVWSCPSGISADGLDLTKDNLGIDSHYVVIKFKNGGAPEVTAIPSGAGFAEWRVDGEHVRFEAGYFYENSADIQYSVIVTGTAANGSLRINGGGKKTLYMNGANITNPSGPAINIQSNKRTDVHLVGSCERRNILKGKGYDTPEGAEQAKGTIFAEGSLVFAGKGTLEVRSTDKHAIVSDEFVEMESGNIIIYESQSDGIHANERINIKGGSLQIKCEGDAIQNERRVAGKESTPCPITVSGGDIKIRTTGTKGHGIVSDSNDVVISGDATKIDISLTGNGSKGIRSRGNVKINGGTIDLWAHGSRESLDDDTSSAAGIKADADVEITRGILTIKSAKANENGKGLNVDGNLKVSGGTTKITSDGDGVRVRGSITMSNGYLETKSANKRDIDCDGRLTKTGGTLIAENTRYGN